MARRNTAILATIGLWLVFVTGIGYWRAYYAWYLGSFYIFWFRDVPFLTLALALILFFEYWYARYKNIP
jgi:hypothetical protein